MRATRRCGTCRHFLDDAVALECELVGLTILSSAQGDTWGDQGICRLHQQMLQPDMSCTRWCTSTAQATPAQHQ